jgi:hypothetical protein
MNKYRAELSEKFGYPEVVSALDHDTINDLHHVLKMYKKPLSPEMRIILRNKMLPYLEKSHAETQQFFESILAYYQLSRLPLKCVLAKQVFA